MPVPGAWSAEPTSGGRLAKHIVSLCYGGGLARCVLIIFNMELTIVKPPVPLGLGSEAEGMANGHVVYALATPVMWHTSHLDISEPPPHEGQGRWRLSSNPSNGGR